MKMDFFGCAGSIEVRKILPKKSSQKVLDYHNYYVELVGGSQGWKNILTVVVVVVPPINTGHTVVVN